MKITKFIILSICIISFSLIVSAKASSNDKMNESQTTTLKAGVSLVENIPNALFGTWRVRAALKDTDSRGTFKEKSVDLWNLSRNNNVMNLSNPFTGASADLSVKFVNGNSVRFTKEGITDNKKLTDTVELKLNGNYFTGVNTITLRTLSDIDNSVIKTQSASYTLSGEKISGASILEE